METILTILGIFNLVISIFSALCFGMSFNDSNYTYKDISNLSCYLIKENNRIAAIDINIFCAIVIFILQTHCI